ncbi:MAG: RidA family protein [Firmicutes bacterium]|nr:RidA family protein [Bacillota bacterium]
MKKQYVNTDAAPKAIGPYSQGVKGNGFLFVSGQLPVHPVTGEIPESVEDQTLQSLRNVKAVLEAGGSSLDKILEATVFIKDMNDFPKINKVYGELLGDSLPARACVEVSRLPKDVKVEIKVIALCE